MNENFRQLTSYMYDLLDENDEIVEYDDDNNVSLNWSVQKPEENQQDYLENTYDNEMDETKDILYCTSTLLKDKIDELMDLMCDCDDESPQISYIKALVSTELSNTAHIVDLKINELKHTMDEYNNLAQQGQGTSIISIPLN